MEVFNVNFEYRSVKEVLENSDLILNFWIIQIIIFILIISLVVFWILYLFPSLKIVFNKKNQEKQKLSKKQALKQILIQKEIENEIEKEINEENQKNHNT